MKINKLQAISIAFCCLVASLWSETQCMDNRLDIGENTCISKTITQTSSRNEIDSLDIASTLSLSINLKDPTASWASYLYSPINSTMQMACKVISFAHNNPKKALFIGFVLTNQIVAVAAECACLCYTEGGGVGGLGTYFADDTACHEYCIERGPDSAFWTCLPLNKI